MRKLQEMFKASRDLIIHTRHLIDENERESIIYNGDERSLTKSFLRMRVYREKTRQIFFRAKVEGDSCEPSEVDEVSVTGLVRGILLLIFHAGYRSDQEL